MRRSGKGSSKAPGRGPSRKMVSLLKTQLRVFERRCWNGKRRSNDKDARKFCLYIQRQLKQQARQARSMKKYMLKKMKRGGSKWADKGKEGLSHM
jgi:hypothetical protein